MDEEFLFYIIATSSCFRDRIKAEQDLYTHKLDDRMSLWGSMSRSHIAYSFVRTKVLSDMDSTACKLATSSVSPWDNMF